MATSMSRAVAPRRHDGALTKRSSVSGAVRASWKMLTVRISTRALWKFTHRSWPVSVSFLSAEFRSISNTKSPLSACGSCRNHAHTDQVWN
eukprot:2900825-Pleurochrysis_carterae.AAC.4